jgi:hypothetical protein
MTQFTAGFITALLLMFVLGTALVLQGLTEKPSQQDEEWNWEREL